MCAEKSHLPLRRPANTPQRPHRFLPWRPLPPIRTRHPPPLCYQNDPTPRNHLSNFVYYPTPFSTQIQCTNGSHFPIQFNDITFFELPTLCSIELTNSTITSIGSRRISPLPLIYNWNFIPTLLPG
jgi:hypothetical protein